MTKKMISLILAAIFCFAAALVACGDNGARDKTSSAQTESGDPAGETGFMNEKIDFGGKTVTVLTHVQHEFSSIIIPEQLNNEPINDAFYERNRFIESEFGIKLELEPCDNPDAGVIRVRNDIETGLHDIQIVVLPLLHMSTLGVEGSLIDLKQTGNNYIHTEKSWWDQSVLRDLTIGDKLWFLAGDAIIEDDEATWAMYFNKGLVESFRLDDPYALVKNGDWTLDKMYELARKANVTNGASMEFAADTDDIWGLLVQSYDCYAFMLGADKKMIINHGDSLEFNVNTEPSVTAFGKIMDIVLDDRVCGVADFYGRWDQGIYDEEYKVFANGHALFMPYTISTVSADAMRNADIRYGILPMPKADSVQENYTTSVTVYWCEAMGIPTGNAELLDAACYAMEAMAYYGMEKVTPEYYNRTLSLKRFPDPESAEMLDIIFRNRVYDLAGVFNFGNTSGSGMLGLYTTLLWERSTDLVSLWNSREDHYRSAVDDFLAQLAERQ